MSKATLRFSNVPPSKCNVDDAYFLMIIKTKKISTEFTSALFTFVHTQSGLKLFIVHFLTTEFPRKLVTGQVKRNSDRSSLFTAANLVLIILPEHFYSV